MKRLKTLFIGLMTVTLAGGAMAATSNGCEKEGADYIDASLALCSTHAYNVGWNENPSDNSKRQLMREVIATKTTIITQQMYKQYEYLDATIRRLKTQLEKAVLTTSLQAAGAADEGSSSTFKSNDRSVFLAGAENCLIKGSSLDGLTCIQNNIRIVLNAVSAGNIGAAKRQLDSDLGFAKTYGVIENKTEIEKCKNVTNSRDSVNDCAYELNVRVMRKIEQEKKSNQIGANIFRMSND